MHRISKAKVFDIGVRICVPGAALALISHDLFRGLAWGIGSLIAFGLLQRWQERQRIASATMLLGLTERQRERVLDAYGDKDISDLERFELVALIQYIDLQNDQESTRRSLIVLMAVAVVATGWAVYAAFVSSFLIYAVQLIPRRIARRVEVAEAALEIVNRPPAAAVTNS